MITNVLPLFFHEPQCKNPVDGCFGNEFPSICNSNHGGVMAAWSCETWKFLRNFRVIV